MIPYSLSKSSIGDRDATLRETTPIKHRILVDPPASKLPTWRDPQSQQRPARLFQLIILSPNSYSFNFKF